MKRTRASLQTFNRLALPEEKAILRAAHQASQKGKPTAQSIASSYQKLSQKLIEFDALVQKLKEAEEAGLIQRKTTSQDDNPVLTWRTSVKLPDA